MKRVNLAALNGWVERNTRAIEIAGALLLGVFFLHTGLKNLGLF